MDATTDRKHAGQVFEDASRAKDHFLAVLSHELRTPLTPALAAIQLLEEEKSLPPELHETLRMIRRNLQLEARLIDDLLDVTRITRNKLELQLTTIDLHEKITHVLGICSADATAKSLVINTHFNAARTQVAADAARLQQILWNVIKNAVKFSHAGGTIDIHTENNESGNTNPGEITVTVTDNGIGMDEAALQNIFNAFEQGGREVTQQFGGLGLGLTISKALVEMHRGTITAASEGLGKGSRFTITLPNKATATHNGVAHPDGKSNGNTGAHGGNRGHAALGCTVLLVEDHNDTRRIMTRLLTRMGCQVKSASTAAEAMTIAREQRLDLIISDIGLPDLSGLDLMRQLKARHGLRGIALSGYGMEEDLQRSKDAGFETHLTKPINLQTLEETVRRMTRA
jgi:nitrogen-specific signal transduction histidine kinase